MAKAWAKVYKDIGALWNYFEWTYSLVTSTDKENDKICPQTFKETGDYTFYEYCGYFGQPYYENSNTNQGEQIVEDNVPTN